VHSAEALLGRPDPPTAVFASNDTSAIVTMDVAATLGLRVPDDLSVVGFDNVPESALAEPALTTIEQPIQLMGERAVEILVDLLAGREPPATHVRLPTRLVRRGTCAPPR
jgi:LacI family transcriptional regulator